MRYFIIAGEASGDLHGSDLVREIKLKDPEAQFVGFGGDLMQTEGVDIVKHYSDMAFMGIVAVLKNLGQIRRNFKLAYEAIDSFNPDVVILIDYPGFNLRIAKYTFQKKCKTYYYISPKVWAWKKGRVKQIKKYVDRMFTIFPFETEFYSDYNYSVDYVGNPTVDQMARVKSDDQELKRFQSSYDIEEDQKIIALLPGSRKQEISRILPEMLNVVDRFKDYRFIITGAPGIDEDYYSKFIGNYKIELVFNETYSVLRSSVAAVVASGTATLETAVLNIPQVVVYKAELGQGALFLKNYILKIKFFSLVNIIVDREIVKELFQKEFNPDELEKQLKTILSGTGRDQLLTDYKEMRDRLGAPGAPVRAAKLIVESLL